MLNLPVIAKASSQVDVLVVDGFGNHDWRATTQDIQAILTQDPAVSCEVSTVPAEGSEAWSSWLPDFSKYDVIIQNTTDISVGGSWPEPAKSAFEAYVSGGGGLYIFHSANNAFPQWKEYNRMIGLGWRNKDFGPAIKIVDGQPIRIPAGEGGNTGHGKRVDALITRIHDHPIHEGLPAQWMAADLEIYRYARGPAENLTVISYAQDPQTGIHFPIEWVVQYGEGRVYNATYGHRWHTQKETPPGMRCLAFQTIFLRSLYWLSGQAMAPQLPSHFPTTEQVLLSNPFN